MNSTGRSGVKICPHRTTLYGSFNSIEFTACIQPIQYWICQIRLKFRLC